MGRASNVGGGRGVWGGRGGRWQWRGGGGRCAKMRLKPSCKRELTVGGSSVATHSLRRRSMKGRSTWCSLLVTSKHSSSSSMADSSSCSSSIMHLDFTGAANLSATVTMRRG